MEDVGTIHELHQRIADYRRLRSLTADKQFLEAINRIITETEEELRKRRHALAGC